MSSPFSTMEEFNNAIDGPTEGAIYTFANTPAINAIALLVAVGLFIWFMFATYRSHPAMPAVDKSLTHLSTLIVVGLLSLVAAAHRADHRQVTPAERAETAPQTRLQAFGQVPLGLLGMVGIGLPARRKIKRRQRLSRNLKDSRSRR